ncbi:hypothetical protein HDU92_003752, partial [Lobulomyces angularis]
MNSVDNLNNEAMSEIHSSTLSSTVFHQPCNETKKLNKSEDKFKASCFSLSSDDSFSSNLDNYKQFNLWFKVNGFSKP